MPVVPAGSFDAAIARVTALTQPQIVATAKAKNAQIVASPPPPLEVVRFVDGVQGAPEESVKPGGVIVYDYARIDQVAEFALNTLRQLSPFDSGNYARSHTLMVNGQVVEDLSGWQHGDEVSISNPEAYTRKIEIGGKGYRAHAHVYEKAEQIVLRRFGNIATVNFVYREAPPGAIHEWAKHSTLSHKGHASTATRQEWLTHQPTLILKQIA